MRRVIYILVASITFAVGGSCVLVSNALRASIHRHRVAVADAAWLRELDEEVRKAEIKAREIEQAKKPAVPFRRFPALTLEKRNQRSKKHLLIVAATEQAN